MDVQHWRNTLEWLTRPDGWIGRRDSKADRAHAVLAGYEKDGGWIAHGIPALKVDQPGGRVAAFKPDAAYTAELQRDAIFQLAALHELRTWGSRLPQDGGSHSQVETLRRDVVQAALAATMGLRAKAVQETRAGPYAEVDFAHRESATQFFEAVVRPRLMRLDASLGLADHVPHRYEPSAEVLIEQWGRVWSAGVALAHLDWASAKNCHTVRSLARAIWCERDPDGNSLSSFRPSPALIPTERKLVLKAHAEVRTRAAVTYAFAGNEEVRKLQADEPSAFGLALRSLSDARRVGEERLYDGYNRAHLYLAVWSDCLHFANGAPGMRKSGRLPEEHTDDDTTDTLAAEQRAALINVKAMRHRVRAMREAMRDAHRFLPGGQAEPASPDPVTGALAGWEPISQGSLRLLPLEPVPNARWQPIASIDLWRELDPDLHWVDLLVVARVADRQLALPITIEDEEVDDSDAPRSVLVLDEGANPPVRADALRLALQAADALIGVVVPKSLGAFVVLEVDMDAPHSPADRA